MNSAIFLAAILAADPFSSYERKDFDALYARQDARIAEYARETTAAQPKEIRLSRGHRKMYGNPFPLSNASRKMLQEIWSALQQ